MKIIKVHMACATGRRFRLMAVGKRLGDRPEGDELIAVAEET